MAAMNINQEQFHKAMESGKAILADILGGLMIFPNLFLLFKLRGEVR